MPDQQPNLFLASVQYLTGADEMPMNEAELSSFIRKRGNEVAALMRTHHTQTHEVGRCAVLLPALPEGPLALVEVGANAGLCLMFDKFFYDYGSTQIGNSASPVRLPCSLIGSVNPSLVVPRIVWRCGLDIDPIDLNSNEDVNWLLACMSPDHVERRQRLETAIKFCRGKVPPVRQGDLVKDLSALLADAPIEATLVVFHSAVFPYVSVEQRRAFADLLIDLSNQREIVWISNESPGTRPEIAALAPEREHLRFLIARTTISNGQRSDRLLGLAHPHGADLEWLAAD